jgi:hypothetical protein
VFIRDRALVTLETLGICLADTAAHLSALVPEHAAHSTHDDTMHALVAFKLADVNSRCFTARSRV